MILDLKEAEAARVTPKTHPENRPPALASCIDEGVLVSIPLTKSAEGHPYGEDLVRLKLGGFPRGLDRLRADAIADRLAGIHRERGSDSIQYVRGVRDLLGHEERIMGLLDRYPQKQGVMIPELLEGLEQRCLTWRWRIKGRTHRLRRIHGDLHPWNVLFLEGSEVPLLSQESARWGDPADDLSCLSMAYLFYALESRGESRRSLFDLFRRFWKSYLDRTGDKEILEVAAPYLVCHGLALASPAVNPSLDMKIRLRLVSFMFRVLEAPRFDPDRAEDFLKAD